MTRLIGLLLVLGCLAWPPASYAFEDELLPRPKRGQVPAGYAATYEVTIRAAEDEGRLVVYSTTDTSVASFLIEDFQSMYPRIDVR